MTTRKDSQEINFLIDHIDPLGQGVFKEGDNIFFIPKTLPNETGIARIIKKKKNIHFCQLIKLDSKAPQRTDSPCPHFNECSGCHFLHTDYQSEIEFKQKTFTRMLSKLEINQFETITSPDRLQYRNRIQLHRAGKKMGFYKYQSKQVVEVPNCKIIQPPIAPFLSKVYKDRPNFKSHLELYLKDGSVSINKDLRYAQGGFTQVNQAANEKMLSKISELFKGEQLSVIDLFAGNGNISDVINYKTRMCIDIYPESYSDFINLDLYSADAIHSLRESSIDLLILDPPRAGFKHLNDWVRKFKPKQILYISCHPMTMIRDLMEIKSNYSVDSSFLIDLFPATFHFEGMCVLNRN